MMVKTSQLPKVTVHPTWESLFKQIAFNLDKLSAYTEKRITRKKDKRR